MEQVKKYDESVELGDGPLETDIDFAALLDDYEYERPKRAQILEGVILDVGENEVLVDVGLKRDAFVPRGDLDRLTEEMRDSLTVGDVVLVYVLKPLNADGQLLVSINKALEQVDWDRAEDLLESNEVVDVPIVGYNKGGVLGQFGRIRGFIPQSHVVEIPRGMSGDDLRETKSDMISDTLSVKVIEVNRQRNRLIMSEREARSAVKREKLAQLEIGSVVTGEVVGLTDFGAFVDIGGVDGLVHISNLDRRYVNHPSDVVSVGDEVEVRIDEVDIDRERISLNRAVLLPDPWDSINEYYNPGDLVTGEVTNVADFGVFVALPHQFEGLVHVSEMTTFGAADPTDLLNEGEEVLVRILEIDHAQQRIALSLDAVTAEEQEKWMHERMASNREAPVDEAEDTDDSGEAEPTDEAAEATEAEAADDETVIDTEAELTDEAAEATEAEAADDEAAIDTEAEPTDEATEATETEAADDEAAINEAAIDVEADPGDYTPESDPDEPSSATPMPGSMEPVAY